MGLLPIRPNSLPPVARYTPACAPHPSFSANLAGPERSLSVDISRSLPVIEIPFLSGSLRAAEAVDGPEGEYQNEDGAYGEGRSDARRVAGQKATGSLKYGGERIEACDGLDPTREQ